MTFRIAGAEYTEIVFRLKIFDQIRSVVEVILFRDRRISVSAKREDVFDLRFLHGLRELIDLGLIVVKGSQVHDRLDTVVVLDVLRDLDRAVAATTSPGSERYADEVRIKLAQYF